MLTHTGKLKLIPISAKLLNREEKQIRKMAEKGQGQFIINQTGMWGLITHTD